VTPERHVQDFLAVCRLAQAKELTIDQVYFSVQEYSPPHNLTPRTDQLVDCWALLVDILVLAQRRLEFGL